MNKRNDEPCYVMKNEQALKSEQFIENPNSKTDLPFVVAVTEVVKGDAKDLFPNITDRYLDLNSFRVGLGALDLEGIAKQKAEVESQKQRLLKEIADTEKPSTEQRTSPSDKARENAKALLSWIDPNNYKLLRCSPGLDGEIFISGNTPNFTPQEFSFEVNEKEAYVWINWGWNSGRDPVQFKIPFGGEAQ